MPFPKQGKGAPFDRGQSCVADDGLNGPTSINEQVPPPGRVPSETAPELRRLFPAHDLRSMARLNANKNRPMRLKEIGQANHSVRGERGSLKRYSGCPGRYKPFTTEVSLNPYQSNMR